MLAILMAAFLLQGCALFSSGEGGIDQEDMLIRAIFNFDELMDNVENRIPDQLLAHAKGIVIFPTLYKAGIIGGAQIGKGVASVRYKGTGKWGPPAFYKIKGASVGLQAGVKKMDLVLLIMTTRGVRNLFKRSASLGQEDFALAVGPLRKDLEVFPLKNRRNRKAVYSYSYSQGAFAGASIQSAVLTPDTSANRSFYRSKAKPSRIMLKVPGENLPEQAKRFIKELDKLAPTLKKAKK